MRGLSSLILASGLFSITTACAQSGTTVNVTGPIIQSPPANNSLGNYIQTNGSNTADQNQLNPGIVFYNNGADAWGADLGFNSSTTRYRTRLFSSSTGDVVLSSGYSVNSQASFRDGLVLRGDSSNVGIGTATPTQLLEVNGNAKVDGQFLFVGPGGGALYSDSVNTVVQSSPAGSVYLVPVGIDGTRVDAPNGNLRVGGPSQPNAALFFADGTHINSASAFNGSNASIGGTGPSGLVVSGANLDPRDYNLATLGGTGTFTGSGRLLWAGIFRREAANKT